MEMPTTRGAGFALGGGVSFGGGGASTGGGGSGRGASATLMGGGFTRTFGGGGGSGFGSSTTGGGGGGGFVTSTMTSSTGRCGAGRSGGRVCSTTNPSPCNTSEPVTNPTNNPLPPRRGQLRLAHRCTVEVELALLVEHHVDEPLHRLAAVRRAGQVHFHRLADDEVRRHHEDDEQHQHDVHQRGDIDASDFLVVLLRASSHD